MSEQIHDQVSAFVDDELSAEECAFLVRRLERDPQARDKLNRYALISAVLQGELLQPDPQLLRRRVHQALSGAEAPPVRAAGASPARTVQGMRWATPAFGLGIASTVAVVALFAVRELNGVGAEPSEAQRLTLTSAPPSYVVPREPRDIRVVAPPPIRLTNYLIHHGEYASRLSRTSVHSNVVAGIDMPLETEAAVSRESEPELQ